MWQVKIEVILSGTYDVLHQDFSGSALNDLLA